MKIFCKTIFIVCLVAGVHSTFAQVQLVLLKKERVILRLNPGDEFIYRLKNSKRIKRSYVNNLSDTAVFTHHDVVPFHTIDRIYFQRSAFYNRLGSGLLIGGIALFLIDQINVGIVQGKKITLDRGISTVSLTMAGAGLPMTLIKKKSQKIGRKFRLLTVRPNSPFYLQYVEGTNTD